ncbi:MAG TPA: glucose 1-dehydrogenase [Dehalococcoidia bacterium]|nr:glucose 1-dehydrogenase [Dehalococcoidia bacterium]
MSPVLQDKVAIITGASRGLGKAFALRFIEEGAKLLLTTTNIERAEETAKELKTKGGEVVFIEADISVESDTKKIADSVIKEYGKVDILVNNAAIWFGIRMKPWNLWTEEEWDRIFSVNVKGTWMVSKAVVPLMIEAGKGKVINIASNVARVGGAPFFMPYACGKGAIYTMTHALAHALGRSNINVNAVAPGFTATEASLDMTGGGGSFDAAASGQSIPRREEPEDLVGATLFLASPDSDFISGQVLYVDGGTVML